MIRCRSAWRSTTRAAAMSSNGWPAIARPIARRLSSGSPSPAPRLTCKRSSNATRTTGASIPRDRAHGGFQFDAEFFALGFGGIARHPDGFPVVGLTAGERQRNLKSIPTAKSNLPAGEIGDRDNGAPGQLGQVDDAFLNLINRATRSVGSDNDAVAAFHPGRRFE